MIIFTGRVFSTILSIFITIAFLLPINSQALLTTTYYQSPLSPQFPVTANSSTINPILPNTNVEASAPNQLDATLTILKAPRVGEVIDLSYVLKWDLQPNPRNKVWFEFERYDPAIDYPLGEGLRAKEITLKHYSKMVAENDAFSLYTMASDTQQDSKVAIESVLKSGQSQWEGSPLKQGDQVKLDAKVFFPEEGEWIINAMSQTEDGSIHVDREIFLTVNEDSGSIGFPKDYSSGGYCFASPELPIGLIATVGRAPIVGEPFPITVTIQSIIDLEQAEVFLEIYKMDGTSMVFVPLKNVISQGDGTWTGELKKGKQTQFTCIAKFGQEGDWIINFMTKSSPEAQKQPMRSLPIHVDIEKSRFDWPTNYQNPLISQIPQEDNVETSLDDLIKIKSENLISKEISDDPAIQTMTSLVPISGYVKNYDRSLNYVNTKYCRILLLNASGGPIASTHTDDYGYFFFENIEAPSSVSFAVSTYSNIRNNSGENIYVTDSSLQLYSYTLPYYIEETSYDAINIYIYYEQDTQPAWWIKDDLENGFQTGLDLGTNLHSFHARWEYSGSQGSEFSGASSSSPWGYISISSSGANSNPDVVLHEMGHNVMNNIYGYEHWPPGIGSDPHPIYILSDPGFAWTEGWATFWGLVVNDKFRPYPNYLPGTSIWADYEDSDNSDIGWAQGDCCEDRVTKALWDLYDSANDGNDFIFLGAQTIWNAFKTNPIGSNTFHDYAEKLVNSILYSGDKLLAIQSMQYNTIDYSIPATPIGFTASNGLFLSGDPNDNNIELVWLPSARAHGYYVYRSEYNDPSNALRMKFLINNIQVEKITTPPNPTSGDITCYDYNNQVT